jgi:hypothetical protein
VKIVGITATRNGLENAQRDTLYVWLRTLRQLGAREFHHGDCVGGDVQGAALAHELGYRIIAHPPSNPRLRADFPSDEVHPELDYHDRNRNIVAGADVLLACPSDMAKHTGGTWWTIRHARQVQSTYALEIQRPLIIIDPMGLVTP